MNGQYYLHNFLSGQPDLNWWNDEVRAEFDRILRFWFDRGIAGFRIDVAHGLVKDRLLRDDPAATDDDSPSVRRRGVRAVYSMNRPEVHEVYRRWRRIADEYDPPRLLLGETYVLDPVTMASYYGDGDELDLAYNFAFLHAAFDAAELRRVVEATEAGIPAHGWPVWALSTHDAVRFPTRWCAGDEQKVRCALLALLTLRGTPVLYYGDEVGMRQVDVPPSAERDLAGHRDGARTPMPWSPEAGGGFTSLAATPWLPFGDSLARTVQDQRDDPGSTLSFCRRLLGLRRDHADLRRGSYESLSAPRGVWAWRRGSALATALNLGEDEVVVDGLSGTILAATRPERDGEAIRARLHLRPSEGTLLALDA